MPPYPAELRILSQGALLAMSGEKKIAVLVRDLPGLRVELARVQPSRDSATPGVAVAGQF